MKHIINMEQLYRDYRIPIAPKTNKHAREGWIQTHCPFCKGSDGYHLGYNLQDTYFNCWRCGWKPTTIALAGVLNTTENKIRVLIRSYFQKPHGSAHEFRKNFPRRASLHPPRGLSSISGRSRSYLEGRGFDVNELEQTWGIKQLGFNAPKHLRWRIYIPIQFQGLLVSYTTRALSKNKIPKYLACPASEEVMNRNTLLFGYDKVPSSTVIVTEGPMDVFKLGPGAVAVMGAVVSPMQRILLQRFRKIYVVMDNDPTGRAAGHLLANQLSGFGSGLDVYQVTLPDGVNDVGDLSLEDAQILSKNLLSN